MIFIWFISYLRTLPFSFQLLTPPALVVSRRPQRQNTGADSARTCNQLPWLCSPAHTVEPAPPRPSGLCEKFQIPTFYRKWTHKVWLLQVLFIKVTASDCICLKACKFATHKKEIETTIPLTCSGCNKRLMGWCWWLVSATLFIGWHIMHFQCSKKNFVRTFVSLNYVWQNQLISHGDKKFWHLMTLWKLIDVVAWCLV